MVRKIAFLTSCLLFAVHAEASPAGAPRKFFLDLPKNVDDYRYVRVSVVDQVSEIQVSSSSPYTIKGSDGSILMQGEKLAATRIKVRKDGFYAGERALLKDGLIKLEARDGIRIGGMVYLHQILISREPGNKMLAVNEVDLEDYIKSVIAWEANPQWSMDSLKAQAIAARTFALFKMIQNQERKFDVSKDVLSQVYSGKNAAHARTDGAVEATRGQVLTYDGKIFQSYYHSTCGGKTSPVSTLWAQAEVIPPLKGVECRFCEGSKHYRWNLTVLKSHVEQALRKHGYPVASGVIALSPSDQDESGRARKILVTTGGKTKVKINAEDFRIWMGPDKFKSLKIKSIDAVSEGFHFRGNGWGHGVGMCQFGMKYLGEIGYNDRQILKYYYPDSEVTQYYN
jgi:stage II sporulation protein D